MILANVEVSNAGGTTPNFTATISNLGQFLESVRSQLQPAVYVYQYDAENEAWAPQLPNGIGINIISVEEDPFAAGDTITVTVTANEVNVTDIQKRTPDMYDAVVDGVIYRGIHSRTGYVAGESELTAFEDEHPGFIAIEYGFAHMWQLGADGDWVEIGG